MAGREAEVIYLPPARTHAVAGERARPGLPDLVFAQRALVSQQVGSVLSSPDSTPWKSSDAKSSEAGQVAASARLQYETLREHYLEATQFAANGTWRAGGQGNADGGSTSAGFEAVQIAAIPEVPAVGPVVAGLLALIAWRHRRQSRRG